DIGSGDGEVIELFVKVGDRIEADQSILTLATAFRDHREASSLLQLR
ncbi:hypothetical protein HKD51_04705, partial [Pseudomonas fragi]|nr:hypothetical protein [Pseudomonas sp. GC01]